jgi:hypothetical protein
MCTYSPDTIGREFINNPLSTLPYERFWLSNGCDFERCRFWIEYVLVKKEVTLWNSCQSDPKSIPNEPVYVLTRYDWSRIHRQTPLNIAIWEALQILWDYEIQNPLRLDDFSLFWLWFLPGFAECTCRHTLPIFLVNQTLNKLSWWCSYLNFDSFRSWIEYILVKIEETQWNSRKPSAKLIPNERVYLLTRYDWS